MDYGLWDIRSQESGVRSQESGVRSQAKMKTSEYAVLCQNLGCKLMAERPMLLWRARPCSLLKTGSLPRSSTTLSTSTTLGTGPNATQATLWPL